VSAGKWIGSNRRAELPTDWAKRRQDCKRRARGLCQATQHDPKCNGVGSECDHIGDKHDHSPRNLQWLSEPCHSAKTKAQAAAARAALPKAKRPPESHPGLT
jgi:5-methylcytosine-specific restriction protein A